MGILPGTRLGPYEILSAIGAGGMGEVYRAHDSKLGRDVAIKVLPKAFAQDADRMARFQREAKVLASLSHPNIAPIYGLEDSTTTQALVMELVEGPTLADRIKAGPIPIDEAVPIAKQICDALEYAHERGIVHRDLKPANVKVTADDAVKVLDFGLAKAMEGDASSIDVASSPTISRMATLAGVLLGTAAYMSPEQAKAKPVDRRADIWAFGCVLYEMLTGKMAFRGESVTDTLAAVIKEEPDWSQLPGATPTRVRVLLQRCLQKDPKQRLRDIGDARISLDEVLSGAREAPSSPAAGPTLRRLLPWAAAVFIAGAVLTGVAAWILKPMPPRPVARFVITLPPGTEFSSGAVGRVNPVVLSPDGTQLVYSARLGGSPQLYVRSIDSLDDKPISGSQGASSPFFSPDGQWVGFFAEGKLKKVPVIGGSPLVLCDARGDRGASWGADDTIFFAPGPMSGLWQVSARGGTPQPFTKLDRQKGEISHRWPQVLPGGRAVLFTVWTGPGWDEKQVQLQIVGTGERRLLVRGGETAYYLPTGHVVYERAGTLMAVAFDMARLEVGGSTPVTLAEGVLAAGEGAYYSVSDNGLLAYVPGGPAQYEHRLVWVERNGKVEPLAAPPRNYQSLQISPDGQEVALGTGEAQYDVWLYNLARRTFTRLTSEGSSQFPIWTPDGKRVTYRATRAGTRNLFWRMADGSGAEERLTTGEGNQTAFSWSPDGKVLGYSAAGAETAMWVLEMGSGRKSRPFLPSSFNENGPVFSPDGRWLAYSSDETGRYEVYVQPYPGPGRKWQVSADGGGGPVWNRNGRELFYCNRNTMVAVDVATGPSFSAGKPKVLFEGPYLTFQAATPNYDVSPDGQRFLMLKPAEQVEEAPPQINVVLNWFEELKRLVPPGK